MSSNSEKIIFTTQDNEEIEFYVLEQTRINGRNYLLIADSDEEDGEANALILKEKDSAEDETVYDVVEDDEELDAVSKVFEQMLDDIDIEMNKEN